MGWLWGSKSSESETVRNLDPSLRKFLEEEKPAERAAAARQEAPSNVDILRASESATRHTASNTLPQVPRESLYQDGRYADLWKNYRPLQEIEQTGKTDQDRMTDLVDSINERKYQLKAAATENCALESLAIQDCYKNASTWEMLTLCRPQNKAFERCFDMQGKFLKALGFMAHVGDEVAAERVQMHADRLYRQMLEQEAQRKEAQEKGLPVPQYEPVMSKENVARVMGLRTLADREQEVWDRVKPEVRKTLQERLQGKSAEERELEMRVIENEVDMEVQAKIRLSEIQKGEQEARAKRKREGKATIADKAKGWWGWGESEEG